MYYIAWIYSWGHQLRVQGHQVMTSAIDKWMKWLIYATTWMKHSRQYTKEPLHIDGLMKEDVIPVH